MFGALIGAHAQTLVSPSDLPQCFAPSNPRQGLCRLMLSELRPLNCLLSLFGCAIATLGTHQRAPAIDTSTKGRGLAMSGVALLGLAALSTWLVINIAIAVAAVVLGRR
jgi:hypothetical protein